jgi:hypothetical protein
LKSCGAQKQNLSQTKAESKVQHRQCIIPTSSTEQRQSGEQVMKSETSQRQNKEKIKHETPAQKKWRKLRVAGPKLKEVFGRGAFRGEIQACSNLNWIFKLFQLSTSDQNGRIPRTAHQGTRPRQNCSALQNSAPATKHARSSSHNQPPKILQLQAACRSTPPPPSAA